eukprot:1136861-Pelagomonas_calceolata.AAC.16
MQGRQPPVCGCPRHVTPMPGAGFAQPQSATKRGHGPSAWQSGVPRRQQPQIRTAAPTCGLPRPVQGNCKGGLTDGLQVGKLQSKNWHQSFSTVCTRAVKVRCESRGGAATVSSVSSSFQACMARACPMDPWIGSGSVLKRLKN